MDVVVMLRVSAALFVLAALGGGMMAALRFAGKRNPPAFLAMGHGLLAAAGLTLLAYAALAAPVPAAAWWALGLLLAAAGLGAALNLAFQWRGRLLPAGTVLVHAAIAVAGFLALLVALLR